MSKRAGVLSAALLASACAAPRTDEPPAPPSPPILRFEGPGPPAPAPPPEPPPAWIAASRVPEFRKCANCHRVEKGAANGLGPNLYDVFARPAGTSQPDYLYSPALAESRLVWDFATLDRWLAKPRALVPGTKMAFPGLSDAEERKAVIAFLRLRSAARP